MQLSYQVLTNRHLFSYLLPIYEHLLAKLTQRPSLVPLLLFRHVVFNNLAKLLSPGGAPGGSHLLLEVLLSQLAAIFEGETLRYFMRNYDWNFLEVPVCQQSLHLLYEYTENRAHEHRVEFELAKTYIGRIHAQLRVELAQLGGGEEDGKWKFYQVKRREFQELLQEMNEKPKRLLKRIEALKG